ncbi:ThiF family adenylyltransferase [Anaerovibrio sp. RM50]|uniref:tRNA threonylcarbamoyladenosine dehydratase n=1 Tax=Anaerovibrio sp. RM50 TaxID=1200557 RepID=UPI000481E1A2|nr:tRNA threonylcarbamoyladenosine dehydratase [Anaerovibrio sp. RM50]
MESRFGRTELLLGEAALTKMSGSRVVIFGVGGVGSYTVEALARCGIGHFLLIDNDVVSVSNINRQLHALTSTVGLFKTRLMAERIKEINPKAVVETIEDFYLPDNRDKFFKGKIDYIVDAIDTVTAKIDLAVQADKMGVPIISSMGAGNKLNPTEFEVSDIYKTSVCPLARVMRQKLKKLGVKKLKVVYSKEEPIKPKRTSGETDDASNGASQKAVPGSVSFVPSVAGLIVASEVVKDLCSGLIER